MPSPKSITELFMDKENVTLKIHMLSIKGWGSRYHCSRYRKTYFTAIHITVGTSSLESIWNIEHPSLYAFEKLFIGSVSVGLGALNTVKWGEHRPSSYSQTTPPHLPPPGPPSAQLPLIKPSYFQKCTSLNDHFISKNTWTAKFLFGTWHVFWMSRNLRVRKKKTL